MPGDRTKKMVLTAVLTAVICVLGPISVPIGPVPISLTNFAVFIAVYCLGVKRGTLAVGLYLLIGLTGLPVFSGYSGGPAKLAGPTGGYLIGYLPMAVIAGVFIERYAKKRWLAAAGMIIATLVLYAIGTAWLAHVAGMTFGAALSVGVTPFIPVDLLKIAAAALVGPAVRDAAGRIQ